MKINTAPARVGKGQTARAISRAVGRLDPDQHLALLAGDEPTGLAELVEDELTRAPVPNRAARRAYLRSRRLNVKQAAKRHAYLQRAGRRRQQAIAAAYAALA